MYIFNEGKTLTSFISYCQLTAVLPAQPVYVSQMAVTRRKEEEQLASCIYNGQDPANPVLSFYSYIEDDENIVDTVI